MVRSCTREERQSTCLKKSKNTCRGLLVRFWSIRPTPTPSGGFCPRCSLSRRRRWSCANSRLLDGYTEVKPLPSTNPGDYADEEYYRRAMSDPRLKRATNKNCFFECRASKLMGVTKTPGPPDPDNSDCPF